ncbi:MBL fold metallo-hydrolase [Oleispirillum naphthae]|uniref:MBL fold metallo-hydrolase n=1 Tax=Oleispirillum naphthae TaxID=2838853 RepID=UPI00308236AB
MKLGDFTIVALQDALNSRPLAGLIANPGELAGTPGAAAAPDPSPLPVAAFLVDTGKQTVLIDTGLGDPAGKTLARLRAAGYAPERIGAVLLTHLHGDHIGGLLEGGKAAFPQAQVYVNRRETAYWLAADNAGAQKAKAALAPYQAAGRVTLFDGAAAILPGIASSPAYGHTPGHTGYMIESAGRRLLMWADIVHVQALQFVNPNVSVNFDIDKAEARETRKAFLADAAARGYLVAGTHIAFPGIGHVRAAGAGYRWEPLAE